MKKALYTTILILSIICILLILKGKITHEPFDSTKWIQWKETETTMSLRWNMMNDLRKKHKLDKLNQKEVIELLGKPDSESQKVFRYYLGYSKRGINTGSFVIIFNDEKVVKQYYVWQG